MITLVDFIVQEQTNINRNTDGHIHLFDCVTSNIFDIYKPIKTFKKFVGFMGVDFHQLRKYTPSQIMGYYRRFIGECDLNNTILLASALDSQTTIEIYKKYPNIIKGFGELLCYDKYDDIDLPYANLKWVDEILEFNSTLDQPLPVYIHYSLISDERYELMDELLSKYPGIPIVLCHCGIPNKHEGYYINEFGSIYERFLKLHHKYQNLYSDVCDGASKYFEKNPSQIYKLDLNRMIIGTDLGAVYLRTNEREKNKKISSVLKKFSNYGNIINTKKTIEKIFNL